MTADEVVRVATEEWQQGYYAKHNNTNLDDRLGGQPYVSGDAKRYTFYAQDLYDRRYYKSNTNGYSWCTIFCDWCVLKAANFDAAAASAVKPPCASVMSIMRYAESHGAMIRKADILNGTATVLPGDMILAETNNDDGDGPDHIGIVVDVEGSGANTVVYTIEGNTSGWSGTNRTNIKASPDPYNGVNYHSGVYKKKMPVKGKYINSAGFFRPNYSDTPMPPATYDININQISHLNITCPSSGSVGDTINIVATPENSYIVNSLIITVNGKPISVTKSGTSYRGSFVLDGTATVSVTGDIKKEEYSISINQLNNTTTTCDKTKAGYNETITVTLTPNHGYHIANPAILINGTRINIVESGTSYSGTFKIVKDSSVLVEGTVAQSSATITTKSLIDHLTIDCPTSGALNDNISISISAKSRYTLTSPKVLVNGKELSLIKSDNIYTGSFVLSSDTEVVISGTVTPDYYIISTETPEHTEIKCESVGRYGELIDFEVDVNSGYGLSGAAVYANDTLVPITPFYNFYKGSFTLTNDTTLTLTGEVYEDDRPIWLIHYSAPEHVCVDVPSFVLDGVDVTIRVKGETGYQLSQPYVVVNDNAIQMYKENDEFVGHFSLGEDANIVITCTVRVPALSINVQCPDSLIVNCPAGGNLGDSITVSVEAKEHYQINSLEVIVNGESKEVTDKSCTFILEEDTQIYIAGDIVSTKFIITSQAEQGIILDCPSVGDLNEEITVEFHAAQGYVIKNPALVVNGTPIQLTTSGDMYIGRFILTKDTQIGCSGNIIKSTYKITIQPLNHVKILCKTNAEMDELVTIQCYAEAGYILSNVQITVNGSSIELSKEDKIYYGNFIVKDDSTISVLGETTPDAGDIETQVSFFRNGIWDVWNNIEECAPPSYTDIGTHTVMFRVRYYNILDDIVIKSFPEDTDHYEIPLVIN